MALKVGCGGPCGGAGRCLYWGAAFTGSKLVRVCLVSAVGSSVAAGNAAVAGPRLCTANNRFRTGTDSGNPTV